MIGNWPLSTASRTRAPSRCREQHRHVDAHVLVYVYVSVCMGVCPQDGGLGPLPQAPLHQQQQGPGQPQPQLHQQQPLPTAELDVALEYQGTDSCWRSHTSTLAVPVRQPFNVTSKVGAAVHVCVFALCAAVLLMSCM